MKDMRQLVSSPIFFRYLISTFYVIFQVSNLIIFIQTLLSKEYDLLFARSYVIIPTLGQLMQFFQIPQFFQSAEQLQFFLKWNILCYIPMPKSNSSQESENNLASPIAQSSRSKLINMISFMNLVMFMRSKADNCLVSQFISSQCGFLTAQLMIELKSNSNPQLSTIWSKIFCKFVLINLFFGYTFLSSQTFLYALAIINALAGIIYFYTVFQKPFKFGYKHDEINSNYADSFIEIFAFIFFQKFNFGFQQRPIAAIVGTKQEYINLNAGFQAILVFSAVIWDFLNSDQFQYRNQLGRYILHAYTLIFSKKLLEITLNLYRFITQGPFQRAIIIDCQEIKALTDSQIILNYFRFKPLQIQIAISFKNCEITQFRRILQLVLKENKRKITFSIVDETLQLNQNFSFSSPSLIFSEFIELSLGDVAYAKVILEEIAKNQYYYYRFTLKISCKTGNRLTNRAILNVLTQNYDVIPNILTFPTYTTEDIHTMRAAALQIIVFNKNLKQLMRFCSKQIVYDLYEDFNTQT